jgi:DNA primase
VRDLFQNYLRGATTSNMTATQEIKDRLDIVDIIGESVQLRKSGSTYTGFCPFHSNTKTPAFVVFPNSQTWRCFGACADGGDLFSYVMRKNGWDFTETLRVLAQRAGVELKPQTSSQKVQQKQEDRWVGLLLAAANYYHHHLLHAREAEHARQYLAQRSLSAETISTFKIGYALNRWDDAATHFTALGYTRDDLLAVGLLTENEEKGTTYDRFRNRILIPIRNAGGTVVGFGARTLEKDGIPKYLNSPQTPLFDKSRLLFNLDLAKRHIREARHAVIVEGYMDVLQAWQHGFHNVIAQMGTALTEEQLRLLKRQTKKFVIALDADAAGAKATLRSLEVARETLDREVDFGFDARGLVRYEGRLKAEIYVATLPAGKDPDDLIRENPAQWEKLIEQAQPTVAYVIDVLMQDLDMADPKAKSAVAHRIAPLIHDIPDAIERDHYWQLLSRKLGVDLRSLREVATTVPSRKKTVRATSQTARAKRNGNSASRFDQQQSDFLCHCIHFPQLVLLVDDRLKNNKQPTVSVRDFITIEDKLLWDYLCEQAYDGAVELDDWETIMDGNVVTRADQLKQLPVTDPAQVDRLPDSLTLSVLEWRLEAAKILREQLKLLIDEAKLNGDQSALNDHLQQIVGLTLLSSSIDQARHNLSASGKR